MQAGRVPTAVVGPVIRELIEERWPDEDGCKVLAEEVGCDPETIRGMVAQRNLGVGFDLIDRVLAKLGRPDLWEGRLADVYPETFWATCASPVCGRQFPEYQHGPVKRYCSKRCAAMVYNIEHGKGSGTTVRGCCHRGHKLTPENTVQQNGRRICRTCKNERQRAWRRRQ